MRNALLCFLAALCVSVNSELSPWPSLRLLASEKTEAWQLLATGWARITPKTSLAPPINKSELRMTPPYVRPLFSVTSNLTRYYFQTSNKIKITHQSHCALLFFYRITDWRWERWGGVCVCPSVSLFVWECVCVWSVSLQRLQSIRGECRPRLSRVRVTSCY